jgi:hypothetical protein
MSNCGGCSSNMNFTRAVNNMLNVNLNNIGITSNQKKMNNAYIKTNNGQFLKYIKK